MMAWRTTAPACMNEDTREVYLLLRRNPLGLNIRQMEEALGRETGDEGIKQAVRWLKSHNYIARVTRRTDNLIVWALHRCDTPQQKTQGPHVTFYTDVPPSCVT
ncbi:MAG: hypothetical protein ACI381_02830 [Candidatus Methanomethylophilaceae archaeon]